MKTVILCGGSGTRLWPISRESSPKQFAQIFDGESLFEKTIARNLNLSNDLVVVVNEIQLPLCKKQVPQNILDSTDFLIESCARNTAPAIALAALSSEPDEVLLILPSDHLIKDQDVYENCVKQAIELANKDKLVTFGIKPQYPETGFGYIEADGLDVKSFKEKPDLNTAIQYIASGNFFWNSGMFCFKASTFLSELEKHSPEIYNESKKTFENANRADAEGAKNIIKFQLDDMQKIPSDSIDYAVMEGSENVNVIPSPFDWSDLGSFDSLYDNLEKDECGNTKFDQYISHNSTNNLIIGNKRVITTFDVSDLIIVDTEDAILIGKKGKSQNVKPLLTKVKELFANLLK